MNKTRRRKQRARRRMFTRFELYLLERVAGAPITYDDDGFAKLYEKVADTIIQVTGIPRKYLEPVPISALSFEWDPATGYKT